MDDAQVELHTLVELVTAMVAVHRGHAAVSWLRDSLERLRRAPEPEGAPLRLAMARSARMLGAAPLAIDMSAAPDLPGSLRALLDSGAWRLVDLGRAALVRQAFARAPGERAVASFGRLLRGGELSEQESLLRALPLLPRGDALLELAIEASRTNATPVFAALALNNPYPARRFPALNFNQLVLKAVFLGLPVTRVVGLGARVTPELARMVQGYASERAAAQRGVPAGVAHIISLSARPASARA